MRPLDEEELKQVFEKLHKFVGKSVEQLVNRPDEPHVFRLHKKVGGDADSRRPPGGPPARVPSPAAAVSDTLLRPASWGLTRVATAQHVFYVRENLMKRAISVRAGSACAPLACRRQC